MGDYWHPNLEETIAAGRHSTVTIEIGNPEQTVFTIDHGTLYIDDNGDSEPVLIQADDVSVYAMFVGGQMMDGDVQFSRRMFDVLTTYSVLYTERGAKGFQRLLGEVFGPSED